MSLPSLTLQPSFPLKIIAIVGTVLALGAIGTFVLLQERSSSQSVPAARTQTRTATRHPAPARVHPKPALPAVQLDANLPAPLASALQRSPLVVAVLHAPGEAVDAKVLAQARQGAAQQHTHVVVLNVGNDKLAGVTAAWMHTVVEPATLVVKRPGTIAVELDGYADSMMVAQAIADSRS
jgi:hypothetical protein